MRTNIAVAADTRELRGKNAARRLRVAGQIPAVLYGAGGGAVAVAVSPKEINRILHSKTGHNTIFNLSVKDGETTPAMIIDWSHDPVKDTLLHVDIFRVDLAKRVHVKVPVHTHGTPVGVKIQGGQFELVVREVMIECLPDDIPEHFEMDVSALEIGGSVRASDLPISGSMKLLSPPDTVFAHVVGHKAEAEATEGAAAEPEVMKKGKKEDPNAKPAATKQAAPKKK